MELALQSPHGTSTSTKHNDKSAMEGSDVH